MALYQVSVLKKYLKLQDDKIIDKAYKKFTSYFQHPEIQENIRKSKEEQFQATFLSELFVSILGYKLNPNPNYNLTTEFKNDSNNRKADGAILRKGNAIGVIELKGTNTKHLEGIRQQAFDYKANQKNCVYVITSNFEKLRFYINDATEFLEFDLFELNRDDFGLLWLSLHHDNIMNGLPLKIKEASLVEEEVITKEFYKDYSVFKRELYRDLVKKNAKELKSIRQSELASESLADEEFQQEVNKLEKNVKLNLFKKSQKLIDRFLFVFFAEDRGLLPPNSIHKIIQNWEMLQDMDVEQSLYERYKIYFNYLNTGREAKGDQAEIFAYNGGLFKPDPILDMLKIDNELLLKHTKKLATYDFESQVDVNILGHIFENSLNEIESVNAEIEGADFDKQKSKRKKDGVFYTPKYITKYIVENTVGKLCNEKKSELGFREEEYYKGRKRRKRETLEQLLKILDDYREWLLKLTICDPACGSGAFLNQALDFLIKEHLYIDEMRGKLLGGSFRFPGIENTILENNIYGVDINEESVEIARLSLWLRTAKPHRKLNDLSGNIKCGNSLIDDKKVAGDKAFQWETEFPEVFKNGGFDVVIGNPPYLRKQGLVENYPKMDEYYQNFYISATANYDIYTLFMERSFPLIKSSGFVSFILPHKFLISDFGLGIRKFFHQNFAVTEILHFGSHLVFSDATTYTAIVTLSKRQQKKLYFKHLSPSQIFDKSSYDHIMYQDLEVEQWFLIPTTERSILDKISLQPLKLRDIFKRFVQGTITGKDECFCVKGELNGTFLEIVDKSGKVHKIEKDILKPHLRGEDVNRYVNLKNNEWLIFPYKLSDSDATLLTSQELKTNYPNTFAYLKIYEPILRKREKGKFNNESWFQFSRNQALSILNQEKIITSEVCYRGSMSYDKDAFYHNSKCHSLILKDELNFSYLSILPILNSSLFWFYLLKNGNILRGNYVGVKRKVLEPFGVPEINEKNRIELEELASLALEIQGQFQKSKGKFISYIQGSFRIGKVSRKLENWHELYFSDFIKELNKAIKKTNRERAKEGMGPVKELTKKDEFEWMELFEENKKIAVELQQQIDQTDSKIDQMIYELYGLTEEEIAIVEAT
ncbi:Eco57I restriction-modification methylase domain-containing protein [Salegentibacter mishustinae]|uniref:Eco57I restriction-modification methylase domain-containing protein n=1 Tax=Salegentibacter mishustinae TaxID=270918 RepID=UPI00248F71B9|nr:N-6 DNA methylase [Salegentibacter mishustinae]